MWRIDSEIDNAGAPYDRRAAVYDRLVRSRLYNRMAWGCAPGDYEAFAAEALAGSSGPVLEAAAGSAAATAALHQQSGRPTVLVDLSREMLERAAQRLSDDGKTVPARIRLVQADVTALGAGRPRDLVGGGRFTTVLALGALHLFDDVDALVAPLRAQLAPGGLLYVSGLVAETGRGRRYLEVLHRAGEVAAPRTAEDLRAALGAPEAFRTAGCMAFAVLPAIAA
jgi:SAM-dependent methyltransferase